MKSRWNWASHTLWDTADSPSGRIFFHKLDVHLPTSELESQDSRNGELWYHPVHPLKCICDESEETQKTAITWPKVTLWADQGIKYKSANPISPSATLSPFIPWLTSSWITWKFPKDKENYFFNTFSQCLTQCFMSPGSAINTVEWQAVGPNYLDDCHPSPLHSQFLCPMLLNLYGGVAGRLAQPPARCENCPCPPKRLWSMTCRITHSLWGGSSPLRKWVWGKHSWDLRASVKGSRIFIRNFIFLHSKSLARAASKEPAGLGVPSLLSLASLLWTSRQAVSTREVRRWGALTYMLRLVDPCVCQVWHLSILP